MTPPALVASAWFEILGGTLIPVALASALGAKTRLVTALALALALASFGGGGMFGLNWGEMFIVGSVRMSPTSVSASDAGGALFSASVGASMGVGDCVWPSFGGL